MALLTEDQSKKLQIAIDKAAEKNIRAEIKASPIEEWNGSLTEEQVKYVTDSIKQLLGE